MAAYMIIPSTPTSTLPLQTAICTISTSGIAVVSMQQQQYDRLSQQQLRFLFITSHDDVCSSSYSIVHGNCQIDARTGTALLGRWTRTAVTDFVEVITKIVTLVS